MSNSNVGYKDGLPYIKTMVKQIEQETLSSLKGKKVVSVRYMNASECIGWSKSPLVIIFDDGTYIYAQSDSEGNNAGCLSGGNLNDQNVSVYCPAAYLRNLK